MKNKILLLFAFCLFVVVNTSYFWEAKVGILTFPIFIFLMYVFLILIIVLIGQICYLINEKFESKQRILNISLITIILVLIAYKPQGLIDFENFESKDIFIANRKGAANCMTTFKLKENHTFVERITCFGLEEVKGNYQIKGDTIFFSEIQSYSIDDEYYKFALIKHIMSPNKQQSSNLIRYKGQKDTLGNELWIVKNEIKK